MEQIGKNYVNFFHIYSYFLFSILMENFVKSTTTHVKSMLASLNVSYTLSRRGSYLLYALKIG